MSAPDKNPRRENNSVPHFARISMRGLLLIVLCASIAFASLRYASVWVWTILGCCALLAFMLLAVTAILHRGPRQGFAIGAVVCAAVYAWTAWQPSSVATSSWIGTNAEGVTLPTSFAAEAVLDLFAERTYRDRVTGEIVPGNDPRIDQIESPVDSNARSVALQVDSTYPRRDDFMCIAHLIWGALFALIGGRLGAHFVRKRQSNH